MKKDFTIKKDELGDVWVLTVADGGKASDFGVTGGGPGKGNLLLKVNGDRTEWKEQATEADIIEEGIKPDKHDNMIRVVFKAPRIKDGGCMSKVLAVSGQAP